MTDADKRLNPVHFVRDPADIWIWRFGFEYRIRFWPYRVALLVSSCCFM